MSTPTHHTVVLSSLYAAPVLIFNFGIIPTLMLAGNESRPPDASDDENMVWFTVCEFTVR